MGYRQRVIQPDFSEVTLAGGSFVYRQQSFCIDRLPDLDPGYFKYELKQGNQTIGTAKCQSAQLIQTNLATPGITVGTVDPTLIHLFDSQCHWIETLQIFPPFRGQGYGSLWLDCLCAMLQSEAKLPIALSADATWDTSNPLTSNQLNDWYERHGFLQFPGTEGLFDLRVRDDPQREQTLIRVQQLIADINADMRATLATLDSVNDKPAKEFE